MLDGLLDILLVTLLSLHLLAMNVATAGPLVAIWLKRRQVRYGDRTAGQLGRWLTRQSLVMLTAGLVLGSAMLILLWRADPVFFESLAVVPRRRLWFGLLELVFFYACLGVYLWGWDRRLGRSWLHPLLGLLAATDLIYHFPPLFAVLATLGSRPELHSGELTYRGFLVLMLHPETLARVLHYLLASVAVTGIAVLGFAMRRARHDDDESAGRVAIWGGRLALVPTVLQLLSGVYLLLEVPAVQRARLLGGDGPATLMLAGGLLATLVMMGDLATIALGDAARKELVRAMALMVLVVLLMVGSRHRAQAPQRDAASNPRAAIHFDPHLKNVWSTHES